MLVARPLPIVVRLVRDETLHSFLSRLARDNHIEVRDLMAEVGMRTLTRPPNLDRLAVLAGYPAERLATILADAEPRAGRTRLSPLTGRIACRRCMASRGIVADVWCVRPDERVCRRHRRWLGGLASAPGQHDLVLLPEVVAAQRRHHRLVRRHGASTARKSMGSATVIVDQWSEHARWGRHRQQRLTRIAAAAPDAPPDAGVLSMANYPEVVTLASLVSEIGWTLIASADHRRDRIRFDREAARRLGLGDVMFDSSDPLVTWQEAEALARRVRLHRQPGYRGPEVWLAGTG